MLQHRKQPEHEEALHLLKRAVNPAWLLASILRGAPAPYAAVFQGATLSGTSAWFRPFPMAAITSTSATRITLSGITGDTRTLMHLLLRCTGAQVWCRVVQRCRVEFESAASSACVQQATVQVCSRCMP